MQTKYSHLSVAIPILAELDNLPMLIEMLRRQTVSNFNVYFCVNNPEGWAESNDENECSMYLDNCVALEYLRQLEQGNAFPMRIIDRCSKNNGWSGKRKGVGWARKVLFDAIAEDCDENEIVVSLDADTQFDVSYLESVLRTFSESPEYSALAVPYYHPFCGDRRADRAMLRYEIYMRHYLLSLLWQSDRIQTVIPYSFTALGSAMVFPLWAYRRVGGITPLQGGEDFYLMQKFCKTGSVLLSGSKVITERIRPNNLHRHLGLPESFLSSTIVFPQGRPSSRVPFGTGPAVAKGVDSMDDAYPLYPLEGFRAVADTYVLFSSLYDRDIETPMTAFLCEQLKTDDIWQPLRKNFKTRGLFVHACKERVDGLRILQFLKTFPLRPAEEELRIFCKNYGISIPEDFSFLKSSLEEINAIRNRLFETEMLYRERAVLSD